MKKIAKAMISMGVVLAFAGCSWQIPQTVSVKTNAEYSFSLGNFTNDLGDSMDTTSMMGDSSAEGITKYDYFPGKSDKNTQHYLLEVKVWEKNFAAETAIADAINGLANDAPLDLGSTLESTLGTTSIPETTVGLDFNPTTLLSEMEQSFGDDMTGKISFNSVPVYLYCELTEGVSAKASLKMFYGSNPDNETDPIIKRSISTPDLAILTNKTLTSKPKPRYQKEGDTVITNLANIPCIDDEPKDIKTMVNAKDPAIQENDQLCISYAISDIDGNIPKSVAQEGITITLYAVIDLPVRFDVNSDITFDVSKMSGDSDSGSSSSSSSESSSSEDSEFSKYLNAVNSVTVYYIVYQLPIYAASGMSLSVDLLGDGTYQSGNEIVFVDKNKTITDDDKGSITLHTPTIEKMKANSNFKPNFAINLKSGSVFSLPREKKIDMNLELGFETDGIIQVK